MQRKDYFGIEQEAKIRKSGIRKVFTPHHPIQSLELFFGREKEISKIMRQVNTPGQYSLLYGDRGVGKSSLANIAIELLFARLLKGKIFIKRCDSKDTFLTILEEPLLHCGIEPTLMSTTTLHTEGGQAGLKVPFATAGINSNKSQSHTFSPQQISPSKAAKILNDLEAFLCIDEVDRVASKEDKCLLAEFIKILSDNMSKFKILIVGISDTAEELIGSHPSTQRCLKETKLRRMSSEELEQIITEGAKKSNTRLHFDRDVIQSVVDLSAGYPHFTHLLALKCAEEAVATGKPNVRMDNLERAISFAAEETEGSLRREYNVAIRSRSTNMYQTILTAASKISCEEFTAKQLRDEINSVSGKSITQGSLSNYLKHLVSSNQDMIMTRVVNGIYKFSDPRMPSFIRIMNNDLPVKRK